MQSLEMSCTESDVDMPLFASPNCLGNVAVIGRERAWSWMEVHAASIDLADRLDGYQIVCNLCTSHITFLIAWIAALRRGLVQILPPSRGSADLTFSLDASKQPTIVIVDDAEINVDNLTHCKKLYLDPTLNRRSDGNVKFVHPLDLDFPFVKLYTSGSTGVPEPQNKSLRQLIDGVRILRKRLNEDSCSTEEKSNRVGLFDRLRNIVSSVPLQHMFGIETCLMPSLVYGKIVLDERPLLPLDIQSTFHQAHIHSAWITTPLHLRGIARSESRIKNCSFILTSTMPLSTELAARAQLLAKAPVFEIYGSTETGALATRRTASENEWTLLHDVEISSDENKVIAAGKHFNSPQILNDRIEQTCSRKFKLDGRNSDLIKIGGRRTSLTGLNLILQNLDGLEDGVFYLPSSVDPDARFVLIYVSSVLSRDEIKAYLIKQIDPIFIPRVFIKVDELPRTGSGKLSKQTLTSIHEKWLSKRVL